MAKSISTSTTFSQELPPARAFQLRQRQLQSQGLERRALPGGQDVSVPAVPHPVRLHLEAEVLDRIERKTEAHDDERGRAAELVDQVVHVAGRPVPLQVLPAEEAVLGGVPAEVEQARLRVVEPGIALLLRLEERSSSRRSPDDSGWSLISGGSRAPIVLATEAERLALSPKTTRTTRWSRIAMIFCFVASSPKGARGPSK